MRNGACAYTVLNAPIQLTHKDHSAQGGIAETLYWPATGMFTLLKPHTSHNY